MDDFELITESIRISGDDRVEFEAQPCGCKPTKEGNVICIDSRCINFATQIECTRCGPNCGNKRLTNKEYSQLEVRSTFPKGHGIFASNAISEGSLVGEYLGEIINSKELERRVGDMNDRGEQHMYVMALQGKTYVDSRHKGSLIRFMNHSCDPNCTLERWTVRGRVRLAIFAVRDIAEGEEITVDYNWRLSGRPPTRCYCRTPSCRGFLEVFNNEEITAMLSRRGVWVSCRERLVNATKGDSLETAQPVNGIFNRDGSINSENFVGKHLKVWYDDTKQYSETRVEKYLGSGRFVLYDILRNYSYEEADLEKADANWYYLDESVAASISKKRPNGSQGGDNPDNDENAMDTDGDDLRGFPVIAAAPVVSSMQKRPRLNEPLEALPAIVTQNFRVRYKLAAYLALNDWRKGINCLHIDGLLDQQKSIPLIIEQFLAHIKAVYGLRTARRVIDSSSRGHPYSFEVEVQGDADAVSSFKGALFHAQESVAEAEAKEIAERRDLLLQKAGITLLHDWRQRPLLTPSFSTNFFLNSSPLILSGEGVVQDGLESVAAKLLATIAQIMFQQNPGTYRKNQGFAVSYDSIPQLILGRAVADQADSMSTSGPVLVGGRKQYDLSRELDRDLFTLLHSLCSKLNLFPTVSMCAMMLLTRYLQANQLNERAIARERIQWVSACLIVAQQVHSFPRFAGFVSNSNNSSQAPVMPSFKHKSIKKLVRTAMAILQHRDIDDVDVNVVDAMIPIVLEKCEYIFSKGLHGDLYVSDVFLSFGAQFLFGKISPLSSTLPSSLSAEAKQQKKEEFELKKKEYKQQMVLWQMWLNLREETFCFLWWLRIQTGPSFFVGCSWDELQSAALFILYALQRSMDSDGNFPIDPNTNVSSKRQHDFYERVINKFFLFVMKKMASLNASSFSGIAQSLVLLAHGLGATLLAAMSVTTAGTFLSELLQTMPPCALSVSTLQRLRSFFLSEEITNDQNKRDITAQHLRLRVEVNTLHDMQLLQEQLFKEVSVLHHMPPSTQNNFQPVRLVPLSEAAMQVTSTIPIGANASPEIDNLSNSQPSLQLHPLIERESENNKTVNEVRTPTTPSYASFSNNSDATATDALPSTHTIDISCLAARIVSKEIAAVAELGTLRAWPVPRVAHREALKAQVALNLPASSSVSSSSWKLSSDSLRELCLLQHLQHHSLTVLPISNSTRSRCTHVAFPVVFGSISASEDSKLDNLQEVEEKDDEADDSESIEHKKVANLSFPSFRSALLFRQRIVGTLHQILSSSEYVSQVPLYMRWQWAQDLLRVVSFILEAGVVFSYLDPDFDVSFTHDGTLILTGLSSACLSYDQRHPYQLQQSQAESVLKHDSSSKRKSKSSSAKEEEDLGVDWPTSAYPFLAPELLLGSVVSAATTSYATMMLLFYILTGKTLLKNGKQAGKQLEYVYKLLGTPKINHVSKEFDAYPLAEKFGTTLNDGSESKARVGKVVRALLTPSTSAASGASDASDNEIMKCFSTANVVRSGDDEGPLVAVLKRALDLVPQRRCVHFINDEVLQMEFFTHTTPVMMQLLQRDHVQLLFHEEHVDLTTSFRFFEVPVSVRQRVMTRVAQQSYEPERMSSHPLLPTKSVIGSAAISFFHDSDSATYDRTHHYHRFVTAPQIPSDPKVSSAPLPPPPPPPPPSTVIVSSLASSGPSYLTNPPPPPSQPYGYGKVSSSSKQRPRYSESGEYSLGRSSDRQSDHSYGYSYGRERSRDDSYRDRDRNRPSGHAPPPPPPLPPRAPPLAPSRSPSIPPLSPTAPPAAFPTK